MAIRLHGFFSSGKRYIQVESQPHHITGIFRNIVNSCNNMHEFTFLHAENVYFECPEDGTITFYQAIGNDVANSAIWTYLVYECPESEEKVFRDPCIDTSTNCLQEIFSGNKLVVVATGIHDYLKYEYYESEYLDVYLPCDWETPEGREIVNLLLEEFKAFKSSSLFAEDAGKQYMKAVIDKFIQAGRKVLDNSGTLKDFELLQYEVLKNVRIHEIANLIIEYNDYRLWQAVLPSNSKAIEYAFNAALDLICRI
ncbi:MAG: hypothetical protein HXY43_16640 [Fischerella sp.]|uniref:hypothetical protein n=1 Tax=Fischerella sp. TaxID=1191 RepID=UPI001852ADD6|nr:hypothetical protein [Fischerella sp.]NWF60833.1 hypothetical protein [Fischerella sp.]